MKILLLGMNGQVGWELQRSLAPLGEVLAPARAEADLGNPDSLARLVEVVREMRPDVIVNAAAYTAVDKAQAEPELARHVNTLAAGVLAREAAALGAWTVYYSTDYVFDGSGDQPWKESDPTGPLNVYGQTKRDGELAVAQAGPQHLIFRTSWVYAARGNNFAKTMLRLAQERERLTVISDQVGAPTGAELLADVTAHALRQVLRTGQGAGTYHLAASGHTSWHGYAQHVIATARSLQPQRPWAVQHIDPIPSSAYPTAAQRPLNSRLDCTRLQQAFGLVLPPWQKGVNRMLAELA